MSLHFYLNIKKMEFSQTALAEKNSEVCMAMLLGRTQLVSRFLSTIFVTEFLLNNLGQFCNPPDAAVFVFSHAIRALGEVATYRPPVSTHLLFIFLLPPSLQKTLNC